MRLVGGALWIVFVLFVFAVQTCAVGDTAVHGISYRDDDLAIRPALSDNSIVYQTLTLFFYSNETNSTVVVFLDVNDTLFNATFDFSCNTTVILPVGMHVLSVKINDDLYVFHVNVIAKEYGEYWADQQGVEAMIAKKTADALILRAWSAALTGMLIGVIVMSVYMIRRLQQEIVEVL